MRSKSKYTAQSKKASDNEGNFIVAAVCVAVAVTVFTIIMLVIVLFQMLDFMSARSNRAALSGIVDTFHDNVSFEPFIPDAENINGTHNIPVATMISAFDAQMLEINPHYICWIYIAGTNVDYPVVRAADNVRYLYTSFWGEPNSYGAIFMDYRNTGSHVPHIIIYGHNTRDGSKFGSLRNFLDRDFLARYPFITLWVNDRIILYEIFSVRLTDINDPAYFLNFSQPGSFRAFLERNNAPPDAVQIITLSTCVSRGDMDERLIVQASLVVE